MAKEESKAKQRHEEILGQPATLDHLRKKKPMERLVPIYLDDEPVNHYNDVAQRCERARMRHDASRKKDGDDGSAAEYKRLQAELEDARAALEEVTVHVRFRSIGREAYEKLVRDHPATEQQEKEAQEQFGQSAPFNHETFAPALIAASAVEPQITVDEAAGYFQEWNDAEFAELYQGALDVNTRRRVADLGKGRG